MMVCRPLVWLFAFFLFTTVHAQEWPQWLGDEVRESAEQGWHIQTKAGKLELSTIEKSVDVWVMVSKPAKSYDIAIKTMLNVFQAEMENVRFHLFLLDQQEDMQAWLMDMEVHADLLYTVGSRATTSIYKAYQGGKVPVVSVNAKDPVLLGLIESYQGSGNNFAFTSLNLRADVTLSFISKFDEQLAQIGVLYAERNRSAYLTQYLPLKEEAEKKGILVRPIAVNQDKVGMSLNEVMQKTIAQMRASDPKLQHSILWLTGSSSLLNRVDEINLYAEGLPLLTAVPEAVNGTEHSALMSVGTSFVNNASQAGYYGVRILKGEVQAGNLPVGVIFPPDISFNFKQAERVEVVVPFVLLELASEIYSREGVSIVHEGMNKDINK